MLLKNHTGYWGIHNDVLYWADSIDSLKLFPNALDMDDDQYTELGSGDYCVYLSITTEPEILFLSADKRVTLNEDYEMLQLLLKSVVLGLAPKVVVMVTEVISGAISDAMSLTHDFLGLEEEEPGPENNRQRKSDTTKLTQYMYDFIIYAHDDWKSFNRQNTKDKKTMEELIEAINTYMGTNKSRTSLSRVWNGHINREDLPVGFAYFDYPQKSKTLP